MVFGGNLIALSLKRVLGKAILNRLGVGIILLYRRYLAPSELSYCAGHPRWAGGYGTGAKVEV